MILYHGSNLEVRRPSLHYSRAALDFGRGFYVTSDLEQAQKWARRVVMFRKSGVPVVSVYETDAAAWNELSVLRFASADADWLDLVVGYRLGQPIEREYDVIAGPVADDRTVDVLTQYMSGFFPVDVALRLLLPMKLKDQWALKTEKSLAAVHWKEAITL